MGLDATVARYLAGKKPIRAQTNQLPIVPGGQSVAAASLPIIPQLVTNALTAPVAAPTTSGALRVQYDAAGKYVLWVYVNAAWRGVEVVA